MNINNNISALFVGRQLNRVSGDLHKSTEKLSTGLRINRAGDDATNLAVSEKMRTQINGLKIAERNAMMGLSFIQVAEGNLDQVNDILQRVRELAVQSANGIYSANDRVLIQAEVSQLIQEVDRISTQAEFNRRKLLNGDLARDSQSPTRGSVFFHVGANADQRIRAYVATMNAAAMGFTEQARTISSVQAANSMIGIADQALDRLQKQRADLGGYYNRIEVTVDALRTGHMNMVAAESRLRDADIAEELVDYTKNQILLQSNTAMMAQANMSSAVVLGLLDRL
jgi:flagellin